MGDSIDTRMSLAEQRITQVENWIKDLTAKVDKIDEGVNNHLTDTAREIGMIRQEIGTQISEMKSANTKIALTILGSIIISLAVMVLK